MRIMGIDEAGRGPVMGPLVIAGVICENQQELKALGVQDSKRLSPQRRRGLALEIQRVAETKVLVVGAAELDSALDDVSLNLLEARYFAQLVGEMAPDEVIVDCADTSERRFRTLVLRHVGYELPMRAEHRADDKYPVVSAASIVAKVKRDEEMKRIGAELGGSVGSGYPHDPETIAFLEAWVRVHREMPPHVRTSWKTSRDLMSRLELRKLSEWE